jgi:hypothetical protein
VLSSHRARAAAVAWENDYRTTSLEADLAAYRDLDRARRDERLARLHELAHGHRDFFVEPEGSADSVGALEQVIAMARAPRTADLEVGITPLSIAAARTAVLLGNLEALEQVTATMPDAIGPVRRAYQCLAGEGACAAEPLETHSDDEIAAALTAVEAGEPDDAVVQRLTDSLGGVLSWSAFLSPWTLSHDGALADPAEVEKLAAALRARADAATPAPPRPRSRTDKPRLASSPPVVADLLLASWRLELEASRARWILGELDGARAALARADELEADPRAKRPMPSSGYVPALRAVLVEPAAALRWIEDRLAGALVEDAPRLHLNRALLMLELGRADDLLAALPAPGGCPEGEAAACEAIEWIRFAMQLRAGKPPAPTDVPKPPPDEAGEEAWWCSRLSDDELRAVIADAVLAGPEVRSRVRWWCQIRVGDQPAIDPIPPVRFYALGFLAGDGDVSVYLDTQDIGFGARAIQRARELAATWRGDTAEANRWRERRIAIDEALKAHPALYTQASYLRL